MMKEEDSLDARNWVKNYADYLYSYAFKRLKDSELARDLVQETFLIGLEKLSTFEKNSHVLTWLTAILRNKIIDQFRKTSAIMSISQEGGQGKQEPVDFFEDNGFWKKQYQPQPLGIESDEQLHQEEFESILQRCLNRLPALWMSIFVMKYIEEEKTAAICQELKVTASNYWVIIHRAKLNLRDCLQKNWVSI